MKDTVSVLRWQNKNSIKYSQVLQFIRENYGNLNMQKELLGVSIADQVEMYCDVPNNVADSATQWVQAELKTP